MALDVPKRIWTCLNQFKANQIRCKYLLHRWRLKEIKNIVGWLYNQNLVVRTENDTIDVDFTYLFFYYLFHSFDMFSLPPYNLDTKIALIWLHVMIRNNLLFEVIHWCKMWMTICVPVVSQRLLWSARSQVHQQLQFNYLLENFYHKVQELPFAVFESRVSNLF